MFKKSIIIIFLILFLPAMVAFSQEPEPTATQALTTATTQVAWPPSPMGTDITEPNVLFHTFIRYVYEWGISLGGIAVFIMLVWAGIQYLTSAGDPGKMGSAIKRIQSSILGLVLLLTSWLILNTINPQLVQLRKLPLLIGGIELREVEMMDPTASVVPCDFIVVYSDTDSKGTGGIPINFIEEAKPDQDVIERRWIEGSHAIRRHGDPWTSVQNFRRLTDEEKRMIEKNELNIPRYDNCGNRSDTGEYRKKGHCWINFYFTTGGFLGIGSDPCGNKAASAMLPMTSFTDTEISAQAVTCIEVVRLIPRCAPEGCPKREPRKQCPGSEAHDILLDELEHIDINI